MSLEDRYDRARRGNRDDAFRERVIEVLERIANALENPPTWENPTLSSVAQSLDQNREAYFSTDATICLCGNDPKKACSQCTPARMAWFYTMNPEFTL